MRELGSDSPARGFWIWGWFGASLICLPFANGAHSWPLAAWVAPVGLVALGRYGRGHPWHARMAAFRAVETGATVVRSTAKGRSLAVDPLGRVIGETDYPVLMPLPAAIPIPLSRGRRCPARGGWCPASTRSRAWRLASSARH